MADQTQDIGDDIKLSGPKRGSSRRVSDEVQARIFGMVRMILIVMAAVVPLVITVVQRADQLENKVNTVLLKQEEYKQERREDRILEEKLVGEKRSMLRLNHSSIGSCGSCKAMLR